MSTDAGASYTRQWVAENASVERLLLVIHSKVYDVTDFAVKHPGGTDVLFDVAGRCARGPAPVTERAHALGSRDATSDFEAIGHSAYAEGLLDKYCIGSLKRN